MITAGQIRAMCTDEIAQWLPGYTEPGDNDDGPQRRVMIEQATDWYLIIRIEAERYSSGKDQRFRVIVLAEELD